MDEKRLQEIEARWKPVAGKWSFAYVYEAPSSHIGAEHVAELVAEVRRLRGLCARASKVMEVGPMLTSPRVLSMMVELGSEDE